MDRPELYPCEFVIKIFGKAEDEFEINALSVIRKHIPDLRENAIRTRHSKDGKYLALSVTINATSRDQLDKIYLELTANPHVLMAL